MPKKVLMSIKPEFANRIFEGEKKYEFRRSIFKDKSITSVVVYVSSPVQKILGEFEVGKILQMKVDELWNETQLFSGISKDFFMEYFTGKSEGFAIEIKKVTRYDIPRCIKADYHLTPPQSFVYLT